jgi:hypothetical protein
VEPHLSRGQISLTRLVCFLHSLCCHDIPAHFKVSCLHGVTPLRVTGFHGSLPESCLLPWRRARAQFIPSSFSEKLQARNHMSLNIFLGHHRFDDLMISSKGLVTRVGFGAASGYGNNTRTVFMGPTPFKVMLRSPIVEDAANSRASNRENNERMPSLPAEERPAAQRPGSSSSILSHVQV